MFGAFFVCFLYRSQNLQVAIRSFWWIYSSSVSFQNHDLLSSLSGASFCCHRQHKRQSRICTDQCPLMKQNYFSHFIALKTCVQQVNACGKILLNLQPYLHGDHVRKFTQCNLGSSDVRFSYRAEQNRDVFRNLCRRKIKTYSFQKVIEFRNR